MDKNFDKQQLINALAPWFIQSGIDIIKEGADVKKLNSQDLEKEGTF